SLSVNGAKSAALWYNVANAQPIARAGPAAEPDRAAPFLDRGRGQRLLPGLAVPGHGPGERRRGSGGGELPVPATGARRDPGRALAAGAALAFLARPLPTDPID